MGEIEIPAKRENLYDVLGFIDEKLEAYNCSMRAQMQVDMAAEEIFINIANYSYTPDEGNATVKCCVSEEPLQVIIQFLDNGKPYNPLKRKHDDIELPAEEREIGGLGILLVKENMDAIEYEYQGGRNILTIKKGL